MKFEQDLIHGVLIKRYKRFLADVQLDTGEIITAHCANPGAMEGLKTPGIGVWLSQSDNPKRKLKYSWELAEIPSFGEMVLVGINTAHPNKLAVEAIENRIVPELYGYQELRTEVKYGKNSRIDILLTGGEGKKCYVEVKNVHLLRQKSLAEFPDSVTIRGAKHLNELMDMVKQGHRAVMLYLVQREDVHQFAIAGDKDPVYTQTYEEARQNGVEMLAYKCSISETTIEVKETIDIIHVSKI